MKRTILFAFLIGFCFPAVGSAQGFSHGRNFGLQLNTGLGLTSGRNVKEDLRRDKMDPNLFDPSAGASIRFGLATRVRLVQNLYLEPELRLAFYGQEAIGKNLQIQFEDGTAAVVDMKMNWSNTDIAIGAGPVYYLRLPKSPVQPFFGMGFHLRFFRSGDVKTALQFKDPQLAQLNQSYTTDASDAWEHSNEDQSSVIGVGLAFKTGIELALPGGMAIPFTISYDLNFSSLVSNVFRVETGFAFYF